MYIVRIYFGKDPCKYIFQLTYLLIFEFKDVITVGLEHRILTKVSILVKKMLVEYAKKQEIVIGARMMGGGFGGCTINLVKDQGLDAFIEKATQEYKAAMGLDLKAYVGVIENGTCVI